LIRLYIFNKENFKITVLYFALIIITLIPVVAIGISVSDSEGERFLLFPSIFLSLFLVSLISSIFKKKIFFVIITLILLTNNLIYHYKSISNWEVSSRLSEKIIKEISNIECEKNEVIFVMNLPEKYNGAFVMRNGLHSAVELFAEKHKQPKFKILSTVNVFNAGNCKIQIIEKLNFSSKSSFESLHQGLIIDFSDLEFCK
jgi:hypothetical protein